MLTLAALFALISAFVLPVMAFDPFNLHAQLRPYIQPRALVTRDLVLSETPNQNVPTETIGYLGVPLQFSHSPSPTLAQAGKLGVPIQLTSATSATTVVQAGNVAKPVNQGTFSTSITLPTNKPTSTSAPSGVVGSPVSSSTANFFTEHTITTGLPNWAVLVVVVGASIIFLALVGLVVWQVIKYRKRRNRKAVDEEDVLDAYTKYWKTKRNSGGIIGQGNVISPMDEKFGRGSYI